jgi:hypothetical protein
MNSLYRSTAIFLIGSLTAATMPVMAQSNSLTCSSDDGGYHYCRANTQNQVRLSRQISGSPCQQGYSWGFDYRGIWVDRGCRAQFLFGNSSNNGGNSDNANAAIAAGILGAIVIGSMVASQHHNDDDRDDYYEQQRDAYWDGYRRGQRDWDEGMDPYFRRYHSRYSHEFDNDFSSGYNDGYYNRPSRYR